MNDTPSAALHRLLREHGVTLLDQPRRLEALLRDLCADHRREVNVLMAALRQKVPARLHAAGGAATPSLMARLAVELQAELGLTEAAASGAVDTWADALTAVVTAVLIGAPGLGGPALQVIFIIGRSRSMARDGKIQALNTAIHEMIPHLQRVAAEHPHVPLRCSAIAFCSDAHWHGERALPIEQFLWTDLSAGTSAHNIGRALSMAARFLSGPDLPGAGPRPLLVLISDSPSTDDFHAGLADLLATPWGRVAKRASIGIGEEADHDLLQMFIGPSRRMPLQANNPEALVNELSFEEVVVCPT